MSSKIKISQKLKFIELKLELVEKRTKTKHLYSTICEIILRHGKSYLFIQ